MVLTGDCGRPSFREVRSMWRYLPSLHGQRRPEGAVVLREIGGFVRQCFADDWYRGNIFYRVVDPGQSYIVKSSAHGFVYQVYGQKTENVG